MLGDMGNNTNTPNHGNHTMSQISYTVNVEIQKNTLGMDIEVYQVVGDDGTVLLETRYPKVAALVANWTTARNPNDDLTSMETTQTTH